jgi:hypothetical protein
MHHQADGAHGQGHEGGECVEMNGEETEVERRELSLTQKDLLREETQGHDEDGKRRDSLSQPGRASMGRPQSRTGPACNGTEPAKNDVTWAARSPLRGAPVRGRAPSALVNRHWETA